MNYIYVFIVGFFFVFGAACRTYFLIYRKPLRVVFFSWFILVTWVASANIAIKSDLLTLFVYGCGCMLGNLAAMWAVKPSREQKCK